MRGAAARKEPAGEFGVCGAILSRHYGEASPRPPGGLPWCLPGHWGLGPPPSGSDVTDEGGVLKRRGEGGDSWGARQAPRRSPRPLLRV